VTMRPGYLCLSCETSAPAPSQLSFEVLVATNHKYKGRNVLGPQEAFMSPVGFPMGMLLWAVARALFSNTSSDGHKHGCILHLWRYADECWLKVPHPRFTR
ncbi:hypothetical protein J6590_059274, partial [Homalodisca vitripennis]